MGAATTPWLAQVADVRQEAVAGGASSAQLSLIDTALEQGTLGYDALRRAATRAVECMNAARLDATATSDERPSTFEVPGYQAGSAIMDDEAVLAIVDACDREHFYFASRVYQSQPSAREADDQHFDRHRDALVACLTRNGVQVDGNATQDEIMGATFELLSGSAADAAHTSEPIVPPTSQDGVTFLGPVSDDEATGPDCLTESGYAS